LPNTCGRSVDVNCKPLLLQEPGLSLTGWQAHRVGQLFHKQGGIRSFPDPDLGSVVPFRIWILELDPKNATRPLFLFQETDTLSEWLEASHCPSNVMFRGLRKDLKDLLSNIFKYCLIRWESQYSGSGVGGSGFGSWSLIKKCNRVPVFVSRARHSLFPWSLKRHNWKSKKIYKASFVQ
jgi:hypothetical protein